MPPSNQKAQKAYQFFLKAQTEHLVFSLRDVVDATGWSMGTVKTYKSKKWHFFLENVGEGYCCNGFDQLSEDAFLRLSSQITTLGVDVLRPRFTPAVDSLVDKARESALLAVQVYNNPLVAFRTPAYVVQMIIAFTSAFHGVFERNGSEYWYKDKSGKAIQVDGDTKAWDITECIEKYYKGKTLPEIENLKFFVAVRNKIEHRHIPSLDITFAGKCQALLMNFETLIISGFGQYFALGANLALALQLSQYSREQWESLKRVQKSEYDSIRAFADSYESSLDSSIIESPKYSFRAFLIPRIGNHARSSDVAIEFVHYDPENPEHMENYERQIALIRDRQVEVPVRNKDSLRATGVKDMVRQRTSQEFTIQHHTNAWKLYKVRQSKTVSTETVTKYCIYDPTFNDFVYTMEWVDFLCNEVRNEVTFQQIKSYRQEVKRRRKSNPTRS